MNLLPSIVESFSTLWYLFSHGGWVLAVILVIYLLYQQYLNEIVDQFKSSQEWVFLHIRAPKENLVSTMAVEQIFAQLHAVHAGLTFPEQYIEGRVQLWFSLEIISLGGKISFIIRAPKATRDLVESAFYAQYPGAEISEVSDYLENIEFDPETSDFDLWGIEYKMLEDQALPIKTYRDFEHTAAEEAVTDPLGALFEALSKAQPWEFFGVQIIIQPVDDPSWKKPGDKLVKKLTGEPVVKEFSWIEFLLKPLTAFAEFSFKPKSSSPTPEKKDRNNLMTMTELEKERVTGIQRKISKPGYNSKIRHLYMAPKGKVDAVKKALLVGFMRSLGSAWTNGYKPDTRFTWTSGPKYKISETLEKSYINYISMKRKKSFFDAYKNRSTYAGAAQQVLNTEELATLYHLPLSINTAASAMVDKTDSKKSQPPVNLPVADPEFLELT